MDVGSVGRQASLYEKIISFFLYQKLLIRTMRSHHYYRPNLLIAAATEDKQNTGVATSVDEVAPDNAVYKGMLLIVAVLWGSNFGALKYLDTCGVDVSLLTAMRFFLASG